MDSLDWECIFSCLRNAAIFVAVVVAIIVPLFYIYRAIARALLKSVQLLGLLFSPGSLVLTGFVLGCFFTMAYMDDLNLRSSSATSSIDSIERQEFPSLFTDIAPINVALDALIEHRILVFPESPDPLLPDAPIEIAFSHNEQLEFE